MITYNLAILQSYHKITSGTKYPIKINQNKLWVIPIDENRKENIIGDVMKNGWSRN